MSQSGETRLGNIWLSNSDYQIYITRWTLAGIQLSINLPTVQDVEKVEASIMETISVHKLESNCDLKYHTYYWIKKAEASYSKLESL